MEDFYVEKEHTFTVKYVGAPVKISFPAEYMTTAINAEQSCRDLGMIILDKVHTVKNYKKM